MKVSVWDTYIKRADGSVMHIDILVPSEVHQEAIVYSYGKKYLEGIAESGEVNAEVCKYCHVEEPSEQEVADILTNGYSVLRLPDIPGDLPPQANSSLMILYTIAHSNKYRFEDFTQVKDEALANIIASL